MAHRLAEKIFFGPMSIVTAQGFSLEENWSNLLSGGDANWSTISSQDSTYPVGRINRKRFSNLISERGYGDLSFLEQLLCYVISDVVERGDNDLIREHCRLIISTTKGNIDLLVSRSVDEEEALFLDNMAQRVSKRLGFKKRPMVISNACISGVSALIVGSRLLEAGEEEAVIVAGGDLVSDFVFSGFESFKSLSPNVCRPYDVSRDGLTLGEGVGAIMLTSDKSKSSGIVLLGGSISNDANHISGPSRTGDGLALAMDRAMKESAILKKDLSFINMHGTATVFNDEMESKAVALSGLQDVAVNGLKGYIGHTLGGAGVVEVVLCAKQLKEDLLLSTRGYHQCGCPVPLSLSASNQRIVLTSCLKTASGFGGCNAAVVLAKEGCELSSKYLKNNKINEVSSCAIYEGQVFKDGLMVFKDDAPYPQFIRAAFKRLEAPNMKFYKMDDLSKLGYVAASFLLSDQSLPSEDTAIVLWNHSSSLDTDIKHQESLSGQVPTGASPSIFVYTLPNIVIGEIAIRFGIKGENSFFIQTDDDESAKVYGQNLLVHGRYRYLIVGKCEYLKEKYSVNLKLLMIEDMDDLILNFKQQLIDALNLEELTPDDIDTDAPLFREGLGLDSIDALEIILILEKQYGIRFENPAESKAIFYSVHTLTDYIVAHRK